MKIFVLAKIIVEGYHNRYYTPMIDTGAEANICKYNCLPEDKWEKLKTSMVVTGFNNEESMIKYKAKMSRPKSGPLLAPTLTLLCKRTNQSKL